MWRRRGSAGCQKHKDFLMFSHPPDPGLWGSSVCAEMLAYLVSLPLQIPRNSLVSGLWPAGGGCLGGLPAAASPPPPGIRHRALRLVTPGPCLAIRGTRCAGSMRSVWPESRIRKREPMIKPKEKNQRRGTKYQGSKQESSDKNRCKGNNKKREDGTGKETSSEKQEGNEEERKG